MAGKAWHQEREAVGHTVSTTRRQKRVKVASASQFSFFSSDPLPVEWCYTEGGAFYPRYPNLDNPSPVCPGVYLLCDSRSCQVNSQP